MNHIPASFDRYFRVSVRYRRIFFKLTNSIEATIFLSQAWFWYEQSTQENGSFWKTRRQWEKETGLTRRQQEAARKLLTSLRFIHEPIAGKGKARHCIVLAQVIFDAINKYANSTGGLCDREFPEQENVAKITPIEARRRKKVGTNQPYS